MAHLLQPVGLGQTDSDVYLRLLSHAHVTPADLAQALELSASTVRQSLRRLTSAGLCNQLVGRPIRYVAAPPEVALDSLVIQHHRELDQLRVQARALSVRAQTTGAQSPLIELVEGAEAVWHTLARLELGARQEVLIIDSPPYLASGLNTNEIQALERGVTYRAIYHAQALADSGRLALLERYLEAGEQARSLPDARMKMLIVDREQALVPISFTGSDAATRLLVRSSPLLDALVLSFDTLWQRATPLGAGSTGRTPLGDTVSPRDRDILRLLATGAKDRTIARTLGITERTVVRRIHTLMTLLNATTRFQAGVQAATRGWLGGRA
ncbi:LuxR C-terminal-related transcriptional regulator [Streptomyces sp. PTM05]|uniref:LuxR C-terminal-related transcriptional regulator n=1 Tax=Streptantibioticus parmotrematis TaxID=2873249 RepID=A0ABS7R0T2_9ACTN|nr:TrmB family transcriptional regulator [Streptantibioticus parmotrematis]MBY8889073.1 LuxR C-terminal-related transcriptional regulator [Streptantibioticus parmotrematis]